MSTVRSSALAVVLFVATAAPAAMAQPTGHDHHPSAPAKADAPTPDQPKSDAPAVASSRRIGDPYPLATCPISGAE
ncbi:MAG TPA: hypothetical protein VHC70_03045, partial [Phycisphaerales bacterium]|nr:hypothetical protein [Phycisphaerales bacterium]